MESGGSAGRRGRYEEKNGGQQVNCLFTEATDNEKIKAVYGNYNMWSWLRYWYLDGENYITLMLLDKSYYDYDYEATKGELPKYAGEKHEPSEERTDYLMRRFGFGKYSVKKLSPEELQAELMREMGEIDNTKSE